MLQGERHEALPVLGADNHDLVRRGVEDLGDDAQRVTGLVEDGKPDEVFDIELALFGLVKLTATELQLLRAQRLGGLPAFYAFEVEKKPLVRGAGANDAPPLAADERFDAFAQVTAIARRLHQNRAAYAVRRADEPDHYRVFRLRRLHAASP